MKKITFYYSFILLIFTSLSFSQTYSTGEIVLLDDGELYYSAEIDVTSTLVTLTLNGPDNRYLGLGFGVQSMTTDGDAVIFLNDGTFKLTDRAFGDNGGGDGSGIGIIPILDSKQDWTITSNVLNGEQRTIVATRVLNTGEATDYVFSTSETSIDLVWSIGFSYTLGYHGANRGITMQSFTLSTNDIALNNNEFTLTPNPAKSKLHIRLPQSFENAEVAIYDVLGKKVYARTLSALSSSIDVSKWNNGIYLVRVSNGTTTQTKRFIKQ